MYRIVLVAATAAALVVSLFGCTSNCQQTSEASTVNAVYHWKSYFSPNDEEQKFLVDHDIKRIYIRFFDVDTDHENAIVPEAEVRLYKTDNLSQTEVVPTVFITLNAGRNMQGNEKELASKIYGRIMAQVKAEEIKNVPEIQLDCDWTSSTRDHFFALCHEIATLAHADGRQVSSTIRLHQLSQQAPPVDRGVLMVYNVGNLTDPDETNSILRADIVRNYLNSAPQYALPLDVAYPVFSWGVHYGDGRFQGLRRMESHPDTLDGFRPLGSNRFEIVGGGNSSLPFSPMYHDVVRYESATYDTIAAVKEMVERYLGYRPRHTILYHLDENMLKRYTHEEISHIYE